MVSVLSPILCFRQVTVHISFFLEDVCFSLDFRLVGCLWPYLLIGFKKDYNFCRLSGFFHVIKWGVMLFAAFYIISELHLSNFYQYSLFYLPLSRSNNGTLQVSYPTVTLTKIPKVFSKVVLLVYTLTSSGWVSNAHLYQCLALSGFLIYVTLLYKLVSHFDLNFHSHDYWWSLLLFICLLVIWVLCKVLIQYSFSYYLWENELPIYLYWLIFLVIYKNSLYILVTNPLVICVENNIPYVMAYIFSPFLWYFWWK